MPIDTMLNLENMMVQEGQLYVDTSSPYILKDDSKCILCGKCVRTCSPGRR